MDLGMFLEYFAGAMLYGHDETIELMDDIRLLITSFIQ